MAMEITDQSFEKEVLQHQGVALVDFWAPWCGPCRLIGPIIEELADEYEGRAKIVKLNVDENPETPTAYGIQGIPTLLLFKNGQLVDTLVGLQSKQTLTNRLEAVL